MLVLLVEKYVFSVEWWGQNSYPALVCYKDRENYSSACTFAAKGMFPNRFLRKFVLVQMTAAYTLYILYKEQAPLER